jgi:exosortase/archaeosortase family protein
MPKENKKSPKVKLFDDPPDTDPQGDDVDIDNGKYMLETVKTIALMVIAGILTYGLIRAAYSWDAVAPLFYPFQYAELYITVYLSKVLGVDVWVSQTQDFTMNYRFPDGHIELIQVISACTAVCEMGMMAAIIMVYRGPPIKKRIIWSGIFVGIIFIENIIRLMVNYPLLRYLGSDGWNAYHNAWMEYGQLFVVVMLLGLYIAVVARKDTMALYRAKSAKDVDKKGAKKKAGADGKAKNRKKADVRSKDRPKARSNPKPKKKVEE